MATLYLGWGQDFVLTSNGSLAMAYDWDEIRQTIERTLFSCPQLRLITGLVMSSDYIYDITFGLGVPRLVDTVLGNDQLGEIRNKVYTAVSQTPGVDSSILPVVTISKPTSSTVFIQIKVPLISGETKTLGVTLG